MGKDFYSDDKATMGDRISAAREDAGMTAEALAKKLGIRTSTLNGWENDQREPRANQAQMLAGVLGVSLVWLLNGQGQEGASGAETELTSARAPRDAALAEVQGLQQTLRDATRRLARLEQLLANG